MKNKVFSFIAFVVFLIAGHKTHAQHKSLKLEYLIVSVYEPAQSDVLQSAGQLRPMTTEVDRKLQDMRNMGLIVEVYATPENLREAAILRSPVIPSSAEVLEKASDLGWKLQTAFSQDVNGFPMKVFVFHRKKKKN
ncbi:hypothetical protein JCM31826_00270 [Thermaurantimonas aggregans]|uniref:Uncharacterized protein n=1 Tax=Thermaurantimonas aggregans TaxID=2173829 RepID=A0A401XHR3_9FLAO|nr:hypothetical protein [Thermaurantimonas aggregans]MCX8149468.1 hypothetical protein [Thermaurantimonas aggregans]GCD76545.1 hypothetical protein JCM31826_00270 [Thermaurantimonas aggregans]